MSGQTETLMAVGLIVILIWGLVTSKRRVVYTPSQEEVVGGILLRLVKALKKSD